MLKGTNHNIKTNIMTTLNDILNSELLNEITDQENKDLADSGWSRKDIDEMANFVIKHSK